VDKYLCYRDNTLTNHQLTWTSSCVTETILWRTINLRGQVDVLQRQYIDDPSTYVDRKLMIRQSYTNTCPRKLMVRQSIVSVTQILVHVSWWFVKVTQLVVHVSWYFVKVTQILVHVSCSCVTLTNHQFTWTCICVSLTNHQLTWTSIGVTETILWRTINLRGQVFVLQRQYFDEPPTYVDK
jgi:hypothetical protein